MKRHVIRCFWLGTWILLTGYVVANPPTGLVLKGENAQSFEEANRLASNAVKSAQKIKKKIDEGLKTDLSKEGIATLELEYAEQLIHAARYFHLALSYVKRGDEKNEVMKARLFYAYVSFWQRKYYETAVLGTYVAKKIPHQEDLMALDAAYLAMAAFAQAFVDNKAPFVEKGEDMDLVIKACYLIGDRWPESEQANEALMILGRIYNRQKMPVEAAGCFDKVSVTSAKYAEAQLAAGQAYWFAYLHLNPLVKFERPVDLSSEWIGAAELHLDRGVKLISKQIASDVSMPPDLVLGKMSLAQILNCQERYDEALKLLFDGTHSVIKAVSVANDAQRPEAGITSPEIAMECYMILLRVHLGRGDMEDAVETMHTLDHLVTTTGKKAPSDIRVFALILSNEMKSELGRLKDAGDVKRHERLSEIFQKWHLEHENHTTDRKQ